MSPGFDFPLLTIKCFRHLAGNFRTTGEFEPQSSFSPSVCYLVTIGTACHPVRDLQSPLKGGCHSQNNEIGRSRAPEWLLSLTLIPPFSNCLGRTGGSE
jgi:hypothetical protein